MIPNPWVIVGFLVTLLASSAGAFFYGEHVDGLAWKAKVAQQEATAATLLDQLDKTAAAKDAAQAAASRDMEAQHAKQIQAVSATADAFRAQLDSRLLDAERRQGSSCSVPTSTTQAGEPQPASPGGTSERGSVDPVAISLARNTLKLLQEDVKFCWSYVGTITR